MREGGKRLRDVLYSLLEEVKPGVSAAEIDAKAQERIRKAGGTPSFLGYGVESGVPFPNAVCVSVNEEVVHGFALADKVFRKGDLVTLDIGMWYNDLATDMARTVAVGEISDEARTLLGATRESLDKGIAAIRNGAAMRDYAEAVEGFAKRRGLGVVRDLVGHGVGHAVHEWPQISNYPAGAIDEVFRTGMVVALEPMLTLGGWRVKVLPDGWTFVTSDGVLSAHFEDTIAVTDRGAEILTR